MDEKSGKPHFLLIFKKLDFTETTKNFEQNINISKGIGSFLTKLGPYIAVIIC